jgi:hypothetical protein
VQTITMTDQGTQEDPAQVLNRREVSDMSREFSQHSSIAQDLFGRDTGGFGTACLAAAATDQSAANTGPSAAAIVRRPSFSEDLWQDALRRHCDSRQNWRQLLDRFVKPHH